MMTMMTMMAKTTIMTVILMYCFIPNIIHAAPYQKLDMDNIFRDEYMNSDDCRDEPLFKGTPNTETPENMENLLYIPFPEITVRDFGIHKYVINRNIKTFMNHHTESNLINIIFNSLNQSTKEINRLVMENRAEFDSISENEFVSNFLDFWCAYRLIQLSEFSSNNLDILANIFKDNTSTIREKFEF